MTSEEARELFAHALERAGARDTVGSIDLAQRAIALDPAYPEALEHAGQLLVTRRRRYAEGLAYMERAAAARPDDAGLWYSLGWCSEFAAHEIARRGGDEALDPRALYERAAEAFRLCLGLHPEGKLQGDAEDLLDHVENELLSF
ncbi:MAG TPA: hypothetical protein VFY79_06215 [Dehalococcoidia bacterium]|nr:hypothetical protein [Dehalococcoidia bacterium]